MWSGSGLSPPPAISTRVFEFERVRADHRQFPGFFACECFRVGEVEASGHFSIEEVVALLPTSKDYGLEFDCLLDGLP